MLPKKTNKDYNAYYKSFKNTSHEAPGKIAAANNPKENETSYDVMYIDQGS